MGDAVVDPSVRRNREMFGLCDHFIALADPWAGTFCKLRAGHDGEHEPHYPVRGAPPAAGRVATGGAAAREVGRARGGRLPEGADGL